MRWVSLSMQVDAPWAERLSDALLEHGALSVEVTDADAGTERESPLFGEPGDATGIVWPLTVLTALFGADVDPHQALTDACGAIGAPVPPRSRIESVPEQDWVLATQQQFNPIQITPRLWIVPSWCQPPPTGAVVLELDPGLAFGTGAHPTTWQCLRWLDEHLRAGQSVLDYGCGSGILAIAAKKLHAGRVVATDKDPDALRVTSCNARHNGVLLDILAPEAVRSFRFDIVVANILANPLRLLAPLLAEHTHPAGHIVLAGILEAQRSEVCAAYAEWFDLTPRYSREGWICLTGQRREATDLDRGCGRDARVRRECPAKVLRPGRLP